MHTVMRRLVAAMAVLAIAITAATIPLIRDPARAAAAPAPTSPSASPSSSPNASPSSLAAARLTASMMPSQGAPESVIRIAGKLTDAHGKPVDGASIAIQGSFDDVPRAFSATDKSGAFAAAIQVPPGTAPGVVTVRASLVGDTRYRPASHTWRFTVVGPGGSATPSAQGSTSSPAATGPGPASAASSGSAQQDQQEESTGQDAPGNPGSASPLAVGGQQNSPRPPGLVTALGGRTAVMAFLIVLGSLLALALIGWVIRGIARWIRRRRDRGLSDTGPSDGANDLFD